MCLYQNLTWHAITRRIEIEPRFQSSTLCLKMEKCGDFLAPSGLPFPVSLSASRPHHWTQGWGCSSKWNHYVACAVLLLTASQCAQRSSVGSMPIREGQPCHHSLSFPVPLFHVQLSDSCVSQGHDFMRPYVYNFKMCACPPTPHPCHLIQSLSAFLWVPHKGHKGKQPSNLRCIFLDLKDLVI